MSVTIQAVYSAGVLKPVVPLALEEGETVVVTIAHRTQKEMTQDEWRQMVLSTAGKWQGEIERGNLGEAEEREPLP